MFTSLALFRISGRHPHADPTRYFVIFTAIYGTVFAFISGLVARLIARTKSIQLNFVLAFILAGFASFSLFTASGNHWTQILAIFVFAPISLLGGLFYNKLYERKRSI